MKQTGHRRVGSAGPCELERVEGTKTEPGSASWRELRLNWGSVSWSELRELRLNWGSVSWSKLRELRLNQGAWLWVGLG